MSLDNLANGEMRDALGLAARDAFWLAVILLVMALGIALLLLRSVRDREVLGLRPVVGATYVLIAVAMLCFVGGVLILFY